MSAPAPPRPALLRWPGLVLAAVLAVAWRLSEGDLSALVARGSRDALGAFARGFFPPAHSPELLAGLVQPLLETVAIAVAGLAAALVLAVPLAVLATSPHVLGSPGRPPSRARRLAWAASRALLDVMRSVPEVIWALVLVRAVGLGPAAGVSAIGIGYAGILGKVLAEIFESTPANPGHALAAAGATPLRVFVFATLPAAFPVATSYVLYRLDCALRASAVLGLVGAGGIGVQLELSLKMLAYDEAATILLALFALVAAVDLASAVARRGIRSSRGLLPAGPAALRTRAAVLLPLVAAVGLAIVFLELPVGELLSLAPVRSLARFFVAAYPPDLAPAFLGQIVPAAAETLAVSVLGTAIAAVLGFALAWPIALAARSTGERPVRLSRRAAAWGARGALNLLRTMPELLWALLLVLAVGLGPFAGALALGLHTAGVLGRLYSEAMEEVPPGPVEGLEAAGAGVVAASTFAALPQVAVQLAGYTLYRWEVNVRASAVLGVVGAGGIGKLLHVSIGLFQVHRTLTLVLVVVALVTAVDLVSGALRRRISEGPGFAAAERRVGGEQVAVDAA